MWKSKIAAAPAAIRQFCTHVPVKAKLACIVFLGLLSLRWWMLQNEAIADADRALSLLSQDMAIVAACRNRNQHLLTSLASWRSVPNAGIFIVDWGSSTPVLDALRTAASSSAQSNEEATTQAKPARIHVVRIDPSNATSWRLSSAVNLAASMVDGGQSSSNCIDCSLSQNINATYLLKLDCDHKLDAEFLQRNRDALLQMTQSKAFLAGNWAASRTENDLHVNGAVLLKREAFQEVNGYDERFDTYGFDDEDLYRRLAKAGYQRLDFALDSVLHIQHSDKLRDLSSAVQVPDLNMRVNRRLIPQLEAWSPTLSPSLYRCTSDTPEQLPSSKPEFELAESLESESTSPPQTDLILSTRCSVVRLVRGLRELVHTKVLQRIEREMLLEMIKQTPIAEASLQSLTSSELKSVAAVIPLIVPTRWHKPAPAWIVHVPASLIPNLAKQLSVLASAIAISVRTKRQLVLFWEVGSSRSIFSVLDSSPAFTNVTVLYERLLPVLEEPPFVFLGSLPAPERSSRAESSRPSQRLTLQLLQTEHAPIVVSARAHLTVPDEDFSGTIENEEVRLLRKLRPSRLLKQANRLSVQKALETAVESAQNHKRASTPSIESSED